MEKISNELDLYNEEKLFIQYIYYDIFLFKPTMERNFRIKDLIWENFNLIFNTADIMRDKYKITQYSKFTTKLPKINKVEINSK
mmetsp:Transcript_20409/g.18069  ORF Transcript_20409/g.18069 Transcript_20409/m.18069 type:complete len:84 (+) Transcript_20409:31-282(+)